MRYLEISFDDNRCRNIFVSILKQHHPDTKVYHKSHTSYQKIYVDCSPQQILPLKDLYEQQRVALLQTVQNLLEHSLSDIPQEDLSGEEYVKVNFPSSFSFIFLKEVLKQRGIKIKEGITSSTAIIGVRDKKEFDSLWKGELKTTVERLEKKITAISNKYIEQNSNQTHQKNE